MPQHLTEQQKDTIHAAVTYLIDLPAEEKPLHTEVLKLKEALEIPSLDENHEYILLHHCYFQPTAYFHRLESLNPDISIGLVQEHMLTILTEKVKTASAILAINDLPWDHNIFLKSLQASDLWSRQFISSPLPMAEEEHPEQIPVDAQKIFRAQFLQCPEFRLFKVNITFNDSQFDPIEGDPIHYPDPLDSDADEEEEDDDAFLNRQKPKAMKDAEEKVISKILPYLIQNEYLPAQSEHSSAAAKRLLVYNFYYNAIINHKINFNMLLYLQNWQADFFTRPAAIALINANAITLRTAIHLSRQEWAVVCTPFYTQQLLKNPDILKNIKAISKHQSKMLTLSSVINLQQLGKVSLHDAKRIPESSKKFFRNEFCIRLITENNKFFHEIIKLSNEQEPLFSEPYYCKEILEGHLDLSAIRTLSEHKIKNLLIPVVIQLLKTRKISFTSATLISAKARPVFRNNIYESLLLQGKVDFQDLRDLNAEQSRKLRLPEIALLIQADILIDIEHATGLSDEDINLILKKSIFKLLMRKAITPYGLVEISPETAHLIENNPDFFDVIYHGLCTIEEITPIIKKDHDHLYNTLAMWGMIFSSRLRAILKNTPYTHNNRIDNLATIMQDIKSLSTNYHTTQNHVLHLTVSKFIYLLENDIGYEITQRHNDNSFYVRFLSNLQNKRLDTVNETEGSSEFDLLGKLKSIVELVNDTAQKIYARQQINASKKTRFSFTLFSAVDMPSVGSFQQILGQILDLMKDAAEIKEEQQVDQLQMR